MQFWCAWPVSEWLWIPAQKGNRSEEIQNKTNYLRLFREKEEFTDRLGLFVNVLWHMVADDGTRLKVKDHQSYYNSSLGLT